MGTSLTGKNISASYLGLLKSTDNLAISTSAKTITDGAGNDLPIKLSTAQFLVSDGSVSAPTIGFSNETNTGFYHTTGEINATIAGTNKITIDGSQTHIKGSTLLIDSSDDSGILQFNYGPATNSRSWRIYNDSIADGDFSILFSDTRTSTSYQTALNINKDGNIALGGGSASSVYDISLGGNTFITASNTTALKINRGASYGDILELQSQGGVFAQFSGIEAGTTRILKIDGYDTDSEIRLSTSGSNRFIIDTNGNVRFNSYGGGTITGTATQRLGVDLNGNVIEIPIGAGAVDGAGATGQASFWTDSDTISGDDDFYWDNTNKRLGIATTSPTASLQIENTSSGNATVGAFLVNSSTTLNTEVRLAFASHTNSDIATNRYSYISTINTSGSNGQDMIFATNATGAGGSEAMRIDSSGRVGINEDNPETSLHVEGTIQLGNEEDLAWAYDNGSYYNYISNFYNTTDGLVYRSGSWTGTQTVVAHSFETWTGSAWDKKLAILQNGNVGISTDNPGAKLQIGSATYAPNSNLSNNLLQIKSASGFGYITIGNGDTANSTSYIGGASGFTVFGSVTDAGVQTEHMRIFNDGKVGIGTNSITNSRVQIKGANNTTNAFADGLKVTSNNETVSTQYNWNGINGSGDLLLATGGSERLRINSTGYSKFTRSAGGVIASFYDGTYGVDLASTATGGSVQTYNTNQNLNLNTYGTGEITFTVAGSSEAVRVDSDGNVGIGESNPLAPLHISSNNGAIARFANNSATLTTTFLNVINANDTSNGTVIAHIDDGTSYIGNQQNNALRLVTNDTERIRIDSSGRVGIATTDIEETITIAKHDGGDGTIMGLRSDASFSQFEIATKNSQADWGLQTIGVRNMYFTTNGSERMRITSGGNVGINETNPLQKLHVNSGSGNSPAIFESTDLISQIWLKDSSSSTTYQTGIACSGDNLIFNNGGERMRITSGGELLVNRTGASGYGKLNVDGGADFTGGNVLLCRDSGSVGIGTTGPDRELDVENATDNCVISAVSGTASIAGLVLGDTDDDDVGGILYNNSQNYLYFQSGASERARITSGGYFKASNSGTIPTSSAHELVSNANGGQIAQFTHSGSTPYGMQIKYSGASPNTTDNYFFLGTDSSTNRIIIWGNGNVVNSNNSYGAISDVKLKENITDASSKLDELLQVKVRNFNYIGDDKKQLGVIAQELEEIFPSMIDESPDFEEQEVPQLDENEQEVLDENGDVVMTTEKVDLGTTTKSVKYSVFVPMLIKAMQEQQDMIQELKAEIDELKKKL